MGIKKPIVRAISFFCLATVGVSSGSILPFPTTQPTVSTDYDSVLIKTWEGMKKRNIDAYSTGLVHRPKSEMPGDAVSEGIGYGMLLALYANDQEYFNKIWSAGEETMWNGEVYDWRYFDEAVIGTGAATDAEEDVALALIFADILVQKGVWEDFSLNGVTYTQRANEMINTIWNTMIENGRYVIPGNGWGSAESFLNFGYFAPAFYRVFDAFEETDHDWETVIDQCYTSIEGSPGYDLGMVADWSLGSGDYSGCPGYNCNLEGKMLFKDAIRVLWRVATDYVWWGEPRAKKFLQNAYNFIETPDRANFYDMEGNLVPDSTYTAINGETLERPYREYSPLTLGMWICAAFVGGGPEAAEPFSDSLLTFYEGGDYWGRATDPMGIEDTAHNEMYFDQFLAWFGASLVSGNFANLWPILTDPDPQTPTAWVETPSFSIDTGYDANFNPIELTGKLNKPVNWSISVENEAGDVVFSNSGQDEDVSMTWLGTGENLSACPAGKYTARINAHGLSEHLAEFWLGRAFDISDGNLLIVDDFKDGDKKPYIGSGWTNFFGEDDQSRQQNNSEILQFEVEENNGESELHWQFRVSGDFGWDPFVGFDWTIGPGLDSAFSGLNEIVITARSQDSLGVSVQLVQSNVTTYFVEDSLYLGSEFQTYTLPISEFTGRLGSSTQLDLNLLTAIRFQVQLPQGTENEIIIKDLKLGGDFSSFYQAPEPYVAMPENSVTANRIHRASSMAIRALPNNSFLISAPGVNRNSQVRILSINGRTVRRLPVQEGRAVWDGRSSSGMSVPSGVYVIALQDKNRLLRKNVLISK